VDERELRSVHRHRAVQPIKFFSSNDTAFEVLFPLKSDSTRSFVPALAAIVMPHLGIRSVLPTVVLRRRDGSAIVSPEAQRHITNACGDNSRHSDDQ